MRPKILEIEGLQSFREKQRIDFDQLGETGLFGIFGPTGSGKSTILDAITLALYGEVNRAQSGTQGIINTAANTVKVLFVFELAKGSGRNTYRVERTYQKKKGSENSCEAKVARLVQVGEDQELPLADKARDVTIRVEELIGLRHDDFMRAVVLPQNKFQEFLMLEKSKKREMLERIFYLEEYGRQLTEKVTNRITAVRERLLVVQGELLALGDASEEALKTAEDQLEVLQAQRDKSMTEFQRAEEEFNCTREMWQLSCELEILDNRENKHRETAGAIGDKTRLLETAVRAKSLEEMIRRIESTARNLDEILERLKPVSTLLLESEMESAEVKKSRDSGQFAFETEKKLLTERRIRLEQALEVRNESKAVDAAMDALRDTYIKMKEELIGQDRKIEELQKHSDKLKEEILLKKQQIDRLRVPEERLEQVNAAARLEEGLSADVRTLASEQAHFDDLAAVVTRLGKELADAAAQRELLQSRAAALLEKQAGHVQAKPGDRDTAAAGNEAYHAFKTAVSLLQMKKSDLAVLSQKAGKLESERRIQEERLVRFLAEKETLQPQYRELSELTHQLRRKLQSHAAYLLASELEESCPCPVCGSLHHPSPADSSGNEEPTELEERIRDSDIRLESVMAKIRDVENNWAVAAEQLRSKEAQLDELYREAENRQGEYDRLLRELITKIRNYIADKAIMLNETLHQLQDEAWNEQSNQDSNHSDVSEQELQKLQDVEAVIEKIGAFNSENLKNLNEWEFVRDEFARQAAELNNTLSSLQNAESAVGAEWKVNSEHLAKAEKTLKTLQTAYDEKNLQYRSMAETLGIESAVREAELIREKELQAARLRMDVEKLQATAAGETERADGLKEERRQLAESFATVVNDGKHLKEQRHAKETKLRELAGEADIDSEIQRLAARSAEMAALEKQSAERIEALEARVRSLAEQKNTLEGQRSTLADSLEELNKTLEQQLIEKGFSGSGEVKAVILPLEQLRMLEEEIAAYRQEESNLAAQKGMILKKLDGRRISGEEWEVVRSNYSKAAKEKDESSSAFEVAKNICLTLRPRNGRWKSLNKEFKEMDHKFSLLEHIKSLLKGNSFIEYVAEERLRYIAREASETLGVMTRFRYALELDSDNGFVIRDNANGGVHRPVTSLSGGEVFLTSLSLALALSSQIHLKGQSPLEFFFLDEGFGTLDSSLLDLVLDSLERISTRERVIGLISHVPELRNRISRRLLVDPPDHEGKGSRVTIEKA